MKIELEFSDILSIKPDKLCRICLTEGGEGTASLFDFRDSATFSEKVTLCTGVQLRQGDGLPSAICEPCCHELDSADKFRVKCVNSDTLLKKFYHSDQRHIEDDKKELIELTTVPAPASRIKDEYEESNGDSKYVDQSELDITITQHNLESKPSDFLSFDCGSPGDSAQSLSDQDVLLSKIVAKKHQKKRKKSKRKQSESAVDEVKSENLEDNVSLSEFVSNVKTIPEHFKTCCHVCNKPLKSKNQLQKHIKSMHGEGREERVGTVSGYGANRRYDCTECPYSTPRRQTLLYHIRIHTGEKPYKCTDCDRCFAQPSSLSSHMKSHSDKMYFTCPECGKQFKHKEKYERHKSVHSDEKKFVCTLCNKGLKSQDTLKSHMNRHYNIRNFSCETCGSSFVTRIELLNHAKKHSDEKKFHCTICDFRTRLKQILEKHMKRHTGERAFKCEHCVYTCYDRGELKFHTRKHTREKKYSCPVCQRFFIHSSSVNKHMFRIHGMQYRVNDNVDRRIVK